MRLSPTRFHTLLAAALFCSALTSPAFAQQPEIDKLADDLAAQIDKSAVAKVPNVKAAVIIFAHSDRTVSQLGFVLADQLGVAMAREGKSFEIIDPEKLEAAREQEKWSESEMQDEGIACGVARMAGAGIVILGKHEKVKDGVNGVQVEMRAILASAVGRKTIGEVRGRISLPQEWRLLDALPSPAANKEAELTALAETPLPDGVFKPGKDGVGFPECEYCPDPSFTGEARAAKYSATVKLQLTVSANGKATDIAVLKSARFSLTQSAIEIVKTWRFKPAQNRDGKPVSTRVVIEVTFRLLKE